MATVTQYGQGAVQGVVGTFSLIIYPVQQKGSSEQQWEEEIVKDSLGFDTAWLARNEHHLMDWSFKLLGGIGAGSNENAAAGGAFIAPLATVTLSGFTLAEFNGTYQNISGSKLDLENMKVGDFATKFRKYADPTQNSNAGSIPS